LTHIKAVEDAPSNIPVASSDATILRGLFYVHIYGAFEYAVHLSVTALIEAISDTGVSYAHFEHLFHSIALDSRFESAAFCGAETKWVKRKDLLNEQRSESPCLLDGSMLDDQLQNIHFRTLENLFECFCIGEPVVPELRLRGYIDEIVNNRNRISHGRDSANRVGANSTSAELDRILEAIVLVANHIIDSFDRHFADRRFVAETHRGHYAAVS
jgi:hypothetical protein